MRLRPRSKTRQLLLCGTTSSTPIKQLQSLASLTVNQVLLRAQNDTLEFSCISFTQEVSSNYMAIYAYPKYTLCLALPLYSYRFVHTLVARKDKNNAQQIQFLLDAKTKCESRSFPSQYHTAAIGCELGQELWWEWRI